MPTLYIARHGITEANERAIVLGHADSPLSQAGIRTAHRFSDLLQDAGITHIMTSDLGRAAVTAFLIAARLGFIPRVILTRSLRETNYGDLNYLPRSEVKVRFPSYRKEVGILHPGGESLEVMARRVLDYLRRLEQRTTTPVLVLTHGGPVRAILSHYLGQPFDDCLGLSLEVFLARVELGDVQRGRVSFIAGGRAWSHLREAA